MNAGLRHRERSIFDASHNVNTFWNLLELKDQINLSVDTIVRIRTVGVTLAKFRRLAPFRINSDGALLVDVGSNVEDLVVVKRPVPCFVVH